MHKKIHSISSFTITGFVGLHLFNNTLRIIGADKHIKLVNTLGLFYRNIPNDINYLRALFVQIILVLVIFKTNRKIVIKQFGKLYTWTRLYLAIFFVIHLRAILEGRLFLNLKRYYSLGVADLQPLLLTNFSFHISA